MRWCEFVVVLPNRRELGAVDDVQRVVPLRCWSIVAVVKPRVEPKNYIYSLHFRIKLMKYSVI